MRTPQALKDTSSLPLAGGRGLRRQQLQRLAWLACSAAVVAVVAACGGGGSGGTTESPAPSSTRAVQHAWVANGDDNSISSYAINMDAGTISKINGDTPSGGSFPLALVAHPSAAFVLAANRGLSDASHFGNVAVYRYDTNGALTAVGTPASLPAPKGLVFSRNGRFLLVSTLDSVRVYAFDETTGALVQQSEVNAGGVSAMGLSLNAAGNVLYVANFHSSSVAAMAFDANTGALQALAGSPFASGAHPMTVALSANGSTLITTNQGGANLSLFAVDASTGALGSAVPQTARSNEADMLGPWGLAAHPSLPYAYITDYKLDFVGQMQVGTAPASATAVANGHTNFALLPMAVAISPQGTFALVAAAGADATPARVGAFRIHASTGQLTPLAGSPTAAGRGAQAIAIAP